MIISCENCATKYNINSAFIGLAGRKVKCTTCKHIWNAALPKEEEEKLKSQAFAQAASDNSQENTSSSKESKAESNVSSKKPLKNFLPAIIDRQVPLWLRIAPASILSLAIAIYLVFYSHNLLSFVPELSKVYQYFGIYNTQAVVLQDSAIYKLGGEGEYFDILVKGKIVNRSMNSRFLPGLRLSILDSNGSNIVSSVSHSDGSVLEPGEEFQINNKITNLTKKAKYLAIDIGDNVELLLR